MAKSAPKFRCWIFYASLSMLASCASATHSPTADQQKSADIKSGLINPYSSRVVVFMGNIIRPGSDFFPSLDWGRSQVEIFINGHDAGGIFAGEALSIELHPGNFTIGASGNLNTPPKSLQNLTLQPGGIIYLSSDWYMQRLVGSQLILLPGMVALQTFHEGFQGLAFTQRLNGLEIIQDKVITISPYAAFAPPL